MKITFEYPEANVDQCAVCDKYFSGSQKVISVFDDYSYDGLYIHKKCMPKFNKEIKKIMDEIKQEKLIKKLAVI